MSPKFNEFLHFRRRYLLHRSKESRVLFLEYMFSRNGFFTFHEIRSKKRFKNVILSIKQVRLSFPNNSTFKQCLGGGEAICTATLTRGTRPTRTTTRRARTLPRLRRAVPRAQVRALPRISRAPSPLVLPSPRNINRL